jgi:hypothetical protein
MSVATKKKVESTALVEVVAAAAPAEQAAPARPTSVSAPTRALSEWDRVQHVWDWFAVYLWIGCVILVWLFNVVDTIKICLGC